MGGGGSRTVVVDNSREIAVIESKLAASEQQALALHRQSADKMWDLSMEFKANLELCGGELKRVTGEAMYASGELKAVSATNSQCWSTLEDLTETHLESTGIAGADKSSVKHLTEQVGTLVKEKETCLISANKKAAEHRAELQALHLTYQEKVETQLHSASNATREYHRGLHEQSEKMNAKCQQDLQKQSAAHKTLFDTQALELRTERAAVAACTDNHFESTSNQSEIFQGLLDAERAKHQGHLKELGELHNNQSATVGHRLETCVEARFKAASDLRDLNTTLAHERQVKDDLKTQVFYLQMCLAVASMTIIVFIWRSRPKQPRRSKKNKTAAIRASASHSSLSRRILDWMTTDSTVTSQGFNDLGARMVEQNQ